MKYTAPSIDERLKRISRFSVEKRQVDYFLEELKKIFGNRKELNILHCGCHTGFWDYLVLKKFNKKIKYWVAIDVGKNAIKSIDLKELKKMTNFRYYKQKKERKWNLPKMKFDLIIHHDTLEHVKKPYLYLKQSLLFLKPKGLLFFSTPNLLRYTNLMKLFFNKLDFPLLLDGVGSLERGQSYHEQEFTKFQLKTVLEECNFRNIKIEHKFLNVPFFNISFNLKNYYLSHILFAKAQR